jgi:hypothetical protein
LFNTLVFEPKIHAGKCFVKIDNEYYDLNPLSSGCRLEIYLFRNYYFKTTDKNREILDLNFCRDLETNCNNTEGMLVNRQTCKRYASLQRNNKIFEVLNKTAKNRVLRVSLPEGDVCMIKNNTEIRYQVILEMECDSREKYAKLEKPKNFSMNQCVNTIRVKSSHGKILFI